MIVVFFAVFRAQDFRLQFAGKEFHIQELVPQPGVEALRVGVLPWCSGLDVERLEPLNNYFLPSAKLEEKSRDGAKLKRKHDKPLTPFQRLLASLDVSAAMKEKMRHEKAALNPFELHRRLEEGLRACLRLPTAQGVKTFEATGRKEETPLAFAPVEIHSHDSYF